MKPIPPKEPHPSQFPSVRVIDENSPFVKAYRKWQKDMEKYRQELEIYEQNKMIADIKRSNIKLCLKKYKISLK